MENKAKRSLGQNFLTSEQAIKDIVAAGAVTMDDLVLEVGPGKGTLTKALLGVGATVLAIEKDDALYVALQKSLAKEISNKKLILEHDDILKVNFSEHKTLKNKDYKIIANIPYNITGILLRKIFSEKNLPKRVVLMVQKEVAMRIVARDKKESLLSISVKAYGEPKFVKKVVAGSFFPKPKVDSAILLISNVSYDNFKKIDEKKFFSIVKQGFASKRKKLANNLNCTSDILGKCGLDERVRAEDIKLDDWLCIIEEIQK